MPTLASTAATGDGDPMTTDARDGRTIEAAGGVVLRPTVGGTEVLVVHRPRYDDWSLPKGKLDPGEDAATAALREVAEETGVTAILGRELSSATYRVGDRPKRVRWFRMTPESGDPRQRPADHEVALARWVSVHDAAGLLTYGHERAILDECLRTDHPDERGGTTR